MRVGAKSGGGKSRRKGLLIRRGRGEGGMQRKAKVRGAACSERQGEGAMPGGGGMQQKAKVFEQNFQETHFAEHFGFLLNSVK